MIYSIIIPTYNSKTALLRLLSSIPTNNEKIEVIVVDDNSLDQNEIQRVCYSFRDKFTIKTIFNNINRGAGYCRNQGISNSVGKYLIFADSDDFFLPGFGQIL